MTNFNFTAENASAQVESKNVKSTKTKAPKKRGASPFSLVLKSARAQFKKQVEHNTETMRKCIEENIKRYYADPLRFWLDFKNETKVLLDSISFNRDCANLGLVPENVADHIVYEGKKLCNNVRETGLNVLGEQVMKFNAPLFVDTEGLYMKQITARDGNQQTGNAEKTEAVSVPVKKPMA